MRVAARTWAGAAGPARRRVESARRGPAGAAPAATASLVVVVWVPAVTVIVALAPRPTADEAEQRLPERRRSPLAGVAAREEEAIIPRRPRAHQQKDAEQHEPLVVDDRLREIVRVEDAAVAGAPRRWRPRSRLGAAQTDASRLSSSSLEGSPRSLILAKWQLRSDRG